MENTEIEGIKSCLDFSGGYCEQFKRSETCVLESCYKKQVGSEELHTCCLLYDKEASRINQLLRQAQTEEDKGMVYNIVTFGEGEKRGPVKIQKSIEDLIAQRFTLVIPSDPQIGNITIQATIKDKKNKTQNTKVLIASVPGGNEQDDENLA